MTRAPSLYVQAVEIARPYAILPRVRDLMQPIVDAAQARDGYALGRAVNAAIKDTRIADTPLLLHLMEWAALWNEAIERGKQAA